MCTLEVTPVRSLIEEASPSGINQDLLSELDNSRCSLATSENHNTAAATPSTGHRQPYTHDSGSGTDQVLTPIVAQDGKGQLLGLSRSELQDQDQGLVAGAERSGNIAGTQFGQAQGMWCTDSFILDDPMFFNSLVSTNDIFDDRWVHELMNE
jgi:hypothetical protein